MVGKICKKSSRGLVAPPPPSTLPLSNFRAKTVSPLKNFLMDRCPKDEPTATNLVCEKIFPFQRTIGKTCFGVASTPPALGHQRVNIVQLVCSILFTNFFPYSKIVHEFLHISKFVHEFSFSVVLITCTNSYINSCINSYVNFVQEIHNV